MIMDGFFLKSPEEQSDLTGHDAEQQLLLDLWNSGHLAGSWLFAGPKGIGKATLAYRLARFILAAPDPENDLLGVRPTTLSVPETDPVFRSVAQRSHPALKVIECGLKEDELKARQALIDAGKPLDPEIERARKRYDEIRITDIREAETFLHLTVGGNGWRVMIIDSADDMNPNAANALLKSLEEPPEKTVIILISHVVGKLLPTIRSRCRKLAVKPFESNALSDFLKSKGEDIPDADLRTLSLLAEGSPGKAVSLIKQDGVSLFKRLVSFFAAFPAVSVSGLYDFAEKSLKDKDVLKTAQSLLIQWLTDVCVSAEKQDAADIFAGEGAVRRRLQTVFPVLKLMDLTDGLRRAFADPDLDQKQVFVNAVLTLQREAG